MRYKKEVSLHAIQQSAEENFRRGFYCSEALLSAILEHFALDMPREVIAMASGMAIGIGKRGCVCGALNGGVMALGLFFGRTEPGGPQDPRSLHCLALCGELHDWFKAANGKNATCCRILTREFDMKQNEHKAQCIRFTGMVARKAAEIIIRELGLTNLDETLPHSEKILACKAALPLIISINSESRRKAGL